MPSRPSQGVGNIDRPTDYCVVNVKTVVVAGERAYVSDPGRARAGAANTGGPVEPPGHLELCMVCSIVEQAHQWP